MKFIQDASISKAIILSPNFGTYSMAERYRELEQRTKLDFSPTIKLLDYLPVFIDGEFHQKIRKTMAKQISRTKDCQLTASREKLENLFEHTFRRNTRIELVEDFSRPLWRAISSSIVPLGHNALNLVDEIPALFSPVLSIRERIKINDKIRDYLGAYADDEEDRLILLCLASLGARPFVGTLSLSLYEIFEANPQSRMSELVWPEMYPSSSLRYVDRVCVKQAGISDAEFQAGERVRCFTQSKEYSIEENRRALFGFGAHTCLGKSISEKVWGLVVETFSRSDLRAECFSIAMSPHDDPFLMPSQIQIELT
jgi:hypothetical protein